MRGTIRPKSLHSTWPVLAALPAVSGGLWVEHIYTLFPSSPPFLLLFSLSSCLSVFHDMTKQ